MAEHEREDELEGWGVAWKPALWLTLGFFLVLAMVFAGSLAFYRRAGAPHVNARTEQVFPPPRLNAALDRAPGWSYAPPPQDRPGRDPQVEAAMRALAARGDGGYAPLGGRP